MGPRTGTNLATSSRDEGATSPRVPPCSHVPVSLHSVTARWNCMVAFTHSTHLLSCRSWWPGWTNLPWEAGGSLRKKAALSEGRAQPRTAPTPGSVQWLCSEAALCTLFYGMCPCSLDGTLHPIPAPWGRRARDTCCAGASLLQPLWDALTGGPGKPGWPWKPCGDTTAEQDPDGCILPRGGPGGAHLLPLLTSAARKSTLSPWPLQKEGVRRVRSISLHPQPPHSSHNPQDLPLALWGRGDRPSQGVPGKGRNRLDGCGWKDLSPGAHSEGSGGRTPSPEARPQVTHQLPFLPRGAHVASLAFDALGKEGDEGSMQDKGWAEMWGID